MIDMNLLLDALVSSISQQGSRRGGGERTDGTGGTDSNRPQLWDLILSRLDQNPALAKLFAEVSSSGHASDLTRHRVGGAIAEAIESDAAFADAIAALLRPTGGESPLEEDSRDGATSLNASHNTVTLAAGSAQQIMVSGNRRSTTSINSSWVITKVRKHPRLVVVFASAITAAAVVTLGSVKIYGYVQDGPSSPEQTVTSPSSLPTTSVNATESDDGLSDQSNGGQSDAYNDAYVALRKEVKHRIVDPQGWTYTVSDAHVAKYPEYYGPQTAGPARPGTTFVYVGVAVRNDITDRSAPVPAMAYAIPRADQGSSSCQFFNAFFDDLIPGWCVHVFFPGSDFHGRCVFGGDIIDGSANGSTTKFISAGGLASMVCVADQSVPTDYDLTRLRVYFADIAPPAAILNASEETLSELPVKIG